MCLIELDCEVLNSIELPTEDALAWLFLTLHYSGNLVLCVKCSKICLIFTASYFVLSIRYSSWKEFKTVPLKITVLHKTEK